MKEFRYVFPRKVSCLRPAVGACRKICRKMVPSGVQKNFFSDVELCLSEAFTNAIKYGESHDGEDRITLCFQAYPDRLVIKVRDRGRGFNLEELPEPDFAGLPEGGFGLFIIKNKMDRVSYIREPGGNLLTMSKAFKGK